MTLAILNLQARLRACRGMLDSNVLLDIATNDPFWGDWSARALAEAAEHTTLIINPIIYAEVSIGYTTIEALDAALPATLYRRESLPWEAGFLAGRSFLRYRRRGGIADLAPAGFLHRRTRRHRTPGAAHARCRTLSKLFSDRRDPRSGRAPDVTPEQGR